MEPSLLSMSLPEGRPRVREPLAEPLPAGVSSDRPGTLSFLEGDLDLLDLCRLSAACRSGGGVKVRHGGQEGILVHSGARIVHVESQGATGVPAFESLRAWGQWQFESISDLHSAQLSVSCDLPLDAKGWHQPGARASGSLSGLSMRHLIEWAMQGRTCTLNMVSRGRSGTLSFDKGEIREAVTMESQGGEAAAEILGWDDLKVEVSRPPAVATAPIAVADSRRHLGHPERERVMPNVKESLAKVMELDGAMGACIVDSTSGMMLGAAGGGNGFNLEVAAAGNTEVVRAKRRTIKALDLKDTIEDILITLGRQYHIIRPVSSNDALFIYAVLDKTRSNLAMARHALGQIDKNLVVQ